MIRVLLSLFVVTSAYQQDLAKLPNGKSYGLTLGHPGGATKRATAVASTFYKAGQQWTKAFCMADADGDGQSNGLEMGDPCCKWSVGQTPQFTAGLSDPNSAASTTLNKPCIMSYANAQAKAMLQCAVCIQALQLDMAKPSKNAVEFTLTSVKSCKDATQDDAQKVLCVETLLKNADQLFMDQQNGVTPIQSCMNLGLVCAPTAPPTQPPTAPPTQPPTAPPTPPLPPMALSHVVEYSEPAEESILVPVAASAGGALVLSVLLWRFCKKNEAALSTDDDFHAMPVVEYTD